MSTRTAPCRRVSSATRASMSRFTDSSNCSCVSVPAWRRTLPRDSSRSVEVAKITSPFQM